MRKILLLVVFILMLNIGAAYAQSTPQLDAFLKLTMFSADFTQENYYPGLDTYTHTGKVYIVRPRRALWDYENPSEFYLMEPGSVLHYSGELRQAVKYNVDPNNMDDPSSLLLAVFLDSNRAKQEFKAVENGNTITLTPKKDIGMERITLETDGKSVRSMSSLDQAGNRVTIRFTNVQQDRTIDPSIFRKELPAGTDYLEH